LIPVTDVPKMDRKGKKTQAGRPGTSKNMVPASNQWQCDTFMGLGVKGWVLVQLDTPKGFNIHPKVHKAAQGHKYFKNPLPWKMHKSRAKP